MSGQVVIVDMDRAGSRVISDLFQSFSVAVQCYEDPRHYLAGEYFNVRHVVLIDMELPGVNSLDLIRLAVEKSAAMAVFAMAVNPATPLVVHAIKAGAYDFLEKPISISSVVSMLRNPWATAPNLEGISDAFVEVLTGRELEVVAGLLGGGSSKHIGRLLGISHRTVEVHRRHIFKKLKVTNTAELILRNRADTRVSTLNAQKVRTKL